MPGPKRNSATSWPKLRVLGADHPSMLATRDEIARVMAARGDHAGAEAEHRDVLAARLRVLGPDHPSTLATRHEIAWVVAAQGDHAWAEAEFRDVLAAKLRVLGANRPSVLTTRHEIARVMADKGDHAGAEAEFRDVLAARLRVLGPATRRQQRQQVGCRLLSRREVDEILSWHAQCPVLSILPTGFTLKRREDGAVPAQAVRGG